MKRLFPLLIVACLILIVAWQLFFNQTNYYLVSVIVLILSMLPFFHSFEKKEHTAEEITLIASLIALAVVSRAVFYLVPQVKPIAAVVGASGACLGARRGYLVGAFSMFVSNFLFGQGAWTPFQMVAMGLVGLVFGLVFEKKNTNRISLSVTGFLSVLICYGLVVDMSSVLYLSTDMSLKSVLSIYAAGVPFNLAFAVSTAVFMLLFGVPLCNKINRINIKYAICNKEV